MTAELFRKTYLPLGDQLYRVAFYLLEDRQEAEDAVQDLFVKLLNSGSRLDGVKNAKAYAITLMRNMCIDRIRAASRLHQVECGEDDPEVSFISVESDVIATKEKLRRVLAIIEGLPTKQREVVRQRIIEDRSYEEISRDTGLSENNLRVLLSIARKTIKKEYEND
ncbi:MAG: RNA polymerase sigma factor [Bacteroidales bacterium]|nr:RNA polymerase sigma factor [Bacteroidales bacterium]